MVSPEDGVVVDVVSESAPLTKTPLAAAVTMTSPESAVAAAVTPTLRQAPHPAQGPSGQSPVGGSPDVVVVTASAVVVVVS